MKIFEELTFGAWKPSPSTLYTLLDTMVNEGLLEKIEEYKGKMKRIKYRLTDKAWKIIALEIDFVAAMIENILYAIEKIRKMVKEKGVKPLMDKDLIRERIRMLERSSELISKRISALEKLLEETS